jgi:hypothetical protein
MDTSPLREIKLKTNMEKSDFLSDPKLHAFRGVCDFASENLCMYVIVSTETRVHVWKTYTKKFVQHYTLM